MPTTFKKMESSIEQYLADMEMLCNEAENTLISAGDHYISLRAKEELMEKFAPVTERMKPLQEYLNFFPEYPRWADCASAYDKLNLHMEAMLKHNKRVRKNQI